MSSSKRKRRPVVLVESCVKAGALAAILALSGCAVKGDFAGNSDLFYKRFFVLDSSDGLLHTYEMSEKTLFIESTNALSVGVTPKSLRLAPSGGHMYFVDETNGTVCGVSYDASSGVVSSLSNCPDNNSASCHKMCLY